MNRNTLTQTARSTVDLVREKTAQLTRTVQAKAAEHEELIAQGRDWLRTFAFDRRPVQVVGAAVIVGAVYAAVWAPLPHSAPEAPALVADRVAPIGTVSLAPATGSQVADRTDATRLPAASVN
jgi:hypothetical protein